MHLIHILEQEYIHILHTRALAQSAGAVEYTDCLSAER